MKYEYFKTVIAQVSFDLRQNYDISKPVVFRGECPVPSIVSENAGLRFDSLRYKMISSIGGKIDGHLIEKYNMRYRTGYGYAETPVASTIQWGVYRIRWNGQRNQKFCGNAGV